MVEFFIPIVAPYLRFGRDENGPTNINESGFYYVIMLFGAIANSFSTTIIHVLYLLEPEEKLMVFWDTLITRGELILRMIFLH